MCDNYFGSNELRFIPKSIMVVMATVVMCRARNPACTAASALGKERYING